jgi:hypothetical protein
MYNIHLIILKYLSPILIVVIISLFQSTFQDLNIPVLPEKNVVPIYNWSYLSNQLHAFPLMNENPTMDVMVSRKAIRHAQQCCLTHANQPIHVRNTLKVGFNVTDLKTNPTYTYLYNTTYWINEYLHMGHAHYIIAIIQILQMVKVDRIVLQRAICYGTLCWGMGTMESWYKGFFSALLESAGQPLMPVYVRWIGRDKYVKPMYFSINTENNYVDVKNITNEEEKKPILLQYLTCFEELYSHDNLRLGAIPAVSTAAIRNFKAAAYRMVDPINPITPQLPMQPPYTILFGYRNGKLTRSMDNAQEFIRRLKENFPPPNYIINAFNPSDPPLGFKAQIKAVAEAHVVIANHGAFEMNMIYMRNSSLLMEIFGDYSGEVTSISSYYYSRFLTLSISHVSARDAYIPSHSNNVRRVLRSLSCLGVEGPRPEELLHRDARNRSDLRHS